MSTLLMCGLLGVSTSVQAASSSGYFQQDSTGLVAIEAEHYQVNDPLNNHEWVTATNSGYSGNGALQALPSDSVTVKAGSGPRLAYQVQFTKTGTHYIWIRGMAQSWSSDSLYVGLDGNTSTAVAMTYVTPLGQWVWTNKSQSGAVATINVDAPGLHTVNVWMRESGMALDKLVLSSASSYKIASTDAGPSEISRVTTNATVATNANTSINISIPTGSGSLSLASNPAHGSASVSGSTILYSPSTGYAGEDTLIYKITADNGSTLLATLAISVTGAIAATDVNLTVKWSAAADDVLGYLVYYGPSAETASKQLSDLYVDQGEINPLVPAVTYSAKADLGMKAGSTVCFRVKAYNSVGESGFSDAACVGI